MVQQQMCIVPTILLFLVSLATGEVIDLSTNSEVVKWPSFSFADPNIEITMCWGEFILERSEKNDTTLIVETNIWSELNINDGAIDEVASKLSFDFSKAEGLVEQLGSKEDVYLRVRLSVPSAYVISRIWTTGLFDYYHDASFPEDTNFGSFEKSIGKISDPPEELKTISASSYPEGECNDNTNLQTILLVATVSIVAGLGLIFLVGIVVVRRLTTQQGANNNTGVTVPVASIQSNQTQQQQSMQQSHTIEGNLIVANSAENENVKVLKSLV